MRKKTEFYFLSADGMFIFSFLFLYVILYRLFLEMLLLVTKKKKRKKVLLRFLSPEKAASHYWLNRDGSVGI